MTSGGGDSSTPASGQTDSNGQLNFDINLGADNTATVNVVETLQADIRVPVGVMRAAATNKGIPGNECGQRSRAQPRQTSFPARSTTSRAATFVVHKDFQPDLPGGGVTVSLSCGGAIVSPASQSVTEANAGTFTVSNFTGNPNCIASETNVPVGYITTSCNADLLSPGQCTIMNVQTSANFTVTKDWVPNNGASVDVTLTCQSGTVTAPTTKTITGDNSVTFTVTGYSGTPNCTAQESPIPTGYTSSGQCTAGLVTPGGCTITNTLNTAQFVVQKDFSDNNSADVTVGLICTSGNVANDDTSASETDPANFTVTGFIVGATCTATESPVPPVTRRFRPTAQQGPDRRPDYYLHDRQSPEFGYADRVSRTGCRTIRLAGLRHRDVHQRHSRCAEPGDHYGRQFSHVHD